MSCLVFVIFERKGMTHFPDKLILKNSFYEITFHGNIILMPAELAHQNENTHFCVALHHKVRIRLHPSMVLQVEIYAKYCYTKG